MRHRFALPVLGACLSLLLLAATASAQTGSIAGSVVNRTGGGPIAGAQVQVLGTNIGTIAQDNGRFLLQNVPAGNRVVQVTMLGFRTVTSEVAVAAGQTSTLEISLESEAIPLEEIVVTGVAGATERAKVPFDVAKVNVADLPVPQVSAASALQGKVAGATVVQGSGRPGAPPAILLRGPTSLDASGRSQDPLYIVDGVILASGMVDVDALDIESIEIVKGAAAASLYGSRAANGVVQITTRRGQHIQNNAVRYTVRSEYGQSGLGKDPTALLTTHHQFAMENGQFLNSDGTTCDWLSCSSPILAGPNGDGSAKIVGTDTFPADEWHTYQVQSWPNKTYNQVKRFFDPGDFLQNYISAEGRSGATNFNVSLSNLQNSGVMPGQNGLKRTNFRLNVDQTVRPGLQVSGTGFYSRSKEDQFPESQGNPLFDLTRMPAGVDLKGPDPDDPTQLVLFVDPVNNESPNPLYQMLNRKYTEERGRFLGSANVRWSPMSWMDLDANASYDRYDFLTQDIYPKGYRTLENDVTLNDGWMSRYAGTREALNGSVTSSMTFNLTSSIANRTQLRYSYESQDYGETYTDGYEFAVSNVPTMDNTNQANLSASSYTSTVRADGYFIITNFDVLDKYVVDALIRNDGSSLFGSDQRRQFYGRIGGAWRIAQEPWFNLPFVDELKLRYSYGTAGGRPRFAAQYETYSVNSGRVTPVTLGNKDLKPEYSVENEVGLDASLWQGRLVAGLTYSNTKTEDQIIQVPLPAYAGFRQQWKNAGTIASNTWEGSLDLALLRTQNSRWSVRLLADRTRSKISALTIPAFQYGVSGQAMGSVFYARPGEEIGTFYGVHYATSCADLPTGTDCSGFKVNDEGLLVWVGSHGFDDPQWGTKSDVLVRGASVNWGTPFAGECTDRTTGKRTQFCEVGNSMPDLNWSFSSTYSYKGLSVYGLFDASRGFDIYNQPLQWGTFKRYSGIMDQTGVPEAKRKPVGYYDALYGVSGLQPSNVFVEDGSFVKVRELSATYRFGPEMLARVPGLNRFTSLGLSLIGRNLYTWTDYRGYDPEVGRGGGDTGSAALARVEGYQYPNFRTWTAALEIVF